MSRSRYSYDCEGSNLWRGAVEQALRGKRGQAFIREMISAMDAMPVKELITDNLIDDSGGVCAMGTVAAARGVNLDNISPSNSGEAAAAFGIARSMAAEISFINDEDGPRNETPAERWTRVRAWAEGHLRGA